MLFNIFVDDLVLVLLNVEESLCDGIVYFGLLLKWVGICDMVEEGEVFGGVCYVSQVQEVCDDNVVFESCVLVVLGSQVFCLLIECDGFGEYVVVGVVWVCEKCVDQVLSLDEDYLLLVFDIVVVLFLVFFVKELLGLFYQCGEVFVGWVVVFSVGGVLEIVDFLLL